MSLLDGAPDFWTFEQSGRLRPVVEKFLRGEQLDVMEFMIMRAYLRQWIFAPAFIGAEVERLREGYAMITSMSALRAWIGRAVEAGVDPL